MRTIYSLFAAFVITLFTSFVNAQVQWIANVPFNGAAYTSLYDMIQDGKPAIIALGDIHSQSSERLLASGALQKLAEEHGAGVFGAPFSEKDLRVAFINVQVMPRESKETLPKGVPIINMNESDDALNASGWQELYSIAGTHLFLITADHLVRPLHGSNADELYKEVAFFNSKVRPTTAPDVRLLDATVTAGNKAAIRVQNFSTLPVQNVQVSVMKDGQAIAQTTYNTTIASLEDAVISLALPEGLEAGLTIIAKADGDVNLINNRWTGVLRSANNTSMIAAAK